MYSFWVWFIRLVIHKKKKKKVVRGLAFVQSVENTVRCWNFKASNILLDGVCFSLIHIFFSIYQLSFGVVLLEMLAGLRAYDSKRPDGQESLVNWRKPCLSSKRMVKAMMDTRMAGQNSSVAVLQAAQLTLKWVML